MIACFNGHPNAEISKYREKNHKIIQDIQNYSDELCDQISDEKDASKN